MQLVVLATEPVPGRVMAHLCPPCTLGQAADIAEASLTDTLAAVRATPASRRVIALEGRPGPWLPEGFDVLSQRSGPLGNRLFGIFEDCFHVADEPVLLIGTDTPQVRPEHLITAQVVLESTADAVMGLTPEGGYWLIGLRHLHPGAFAGVPIRDDDTGGAQLERLAECRYRVALTEELCDVGGPTEALAIAREVPGSRFAVAVSAALG
jgi:glycosyltransferase A (GT-A) superfamily protein (DUF2064 family)